jgi:hypothetical protein
MAGLGTQRVNHFQIRLLVSNMRFKSPHFSSGNLMRISVWEVQHPFIKMGKDFCSHTGKRKTENKYLRSLFKLKFKTNGFKIFLTTLAFINVMFLSFVKMCTKAMRSIWHK